MLRRKQHIANFGHAGIAARAAVLEHHHAAFIDLQRIIITARVTFLDVFEDHGSPTMLQQMWARRRELYDRAIGSKVPSQNRNSCVSFEGSVEGVDYVAIPARGVGAIVPNCLAVGGQRVTAQCARLSKLAQNCRESTGIK